MTINKLGVCFMNKDKKKKGFSKKLLIADYVIAVILVIAFFICTYINGTYTMDTVNRLIEMGVDVSMVSINPPFNLDMFGILLGTWIVQLGVSSGAYYVLIKSEHKMELPMELINDLPQDVKEQVDMNQIITTVLSCTNN
jgi:hypothetical protein